MVKLKAYHKKRDFSKTTEPEGNIRSGKGPLRFVVQKHDARRLHYDFRLELNGVLVSWAIPKEPVHDPSVKRLALPMEDHPMDYYDFEGVIPEGNYGAGTVMVWDMGTFHLPENKDRKTSEKELTDACKKGKMKFVLEGKKLKGEFHLVKTKNDQWLFFKSNDEFSGRQPPDKDLSVKSGKTLEAIAKQKSMYITEEDLKGAKKGKIPERIRPMLATLTDEPFDSNDWLFEIKYDGYRAVANITKDKIDLYSRNLKSFNGQYPSIVEALKDIPPDVVLDGEIVVFNKKGLPDFQLLQNFLQEAEETLTYVVFDILYYNGYDLRSLSLVQRKKILKKFLPSLERIKYCDHVENEGENFLKVAHEAGLEGIIAKQKQSIYETDNRSNKWLKVKVVNRQEAIICGYTDPKGSRSAFGSLVLGAHKNGDITFVGKVGTGFDERQRNGLLQELKKLNRKTPPLNDFNISERGVHWVTPKLVCEVKFSEWTQDKHMRHPVFVGLREDKTPDEVSFEKKLDSQEIKLPEKNNKLSFSNIDKTYFPEKNITKGDVIAYYEKIAPYILPYLKDRPQSLRRHPNGVHQEGFFQKNVEGQVPDWIVTQKIESKSKGGTIEYLVCQDKDTLLFLANWGCIELHSWNSRIQHLYKPDYIVFDLDPVDIEFSAVVKIAFELKRILDKVNAPAFLKTSGGRGLHIFVPCGARYSYDQVSDFSKLLSVMLHHKYPDITSLERMPSKRKGKVYPDFLQNAYGKTMVVPYSLRAKPGAPVSTPLQWEDLAEDLDPAEFNIHTIFTRLDEVGDIWKEMLTRQFDIDQALKTLQG